MLQSYITHLKSSGLFDEKYFSSLPGIEITRCVCIGLGNFTNPSKDEKSKDHAACLGPRNDSLLQLAALYIILGFLAKEHSIENVYFQEPKFTDFEIWFLRGLGYIILEDPEAFSLVNSATFLFAPVNRYDVWVEALEHESPAFFIGNCVDWTIENISRLQPLNDYGFEAREAMLETFRRFRKETVVRGIPVCKKYWLGYGEARVLLPKEKTSIGKK